MNREDFVKALKSEEKKETQKVERNPYDQNALEQHISSYGFNIEATPKLSELAKLLSKNEVLDEKEGLTKDESHDILEDTRKVVEVEKKLPHDIDIQAIRKLIQKHKGI